ncbi:MAG: hypothetical protein JXR40_10705, partial [Pontiellaceae bacterium]|nr:hypothetical protein [Pontiellaceae bacterium]
LEVASNITSEVEWEVSIGENTNGTYHAGIAWTNYLSRLAAAPEANSVCWRAGWRDITMPVEYEITSTFTPPGTSSELTTTRIIKSRSLDATDEALRDHFNEDVDMLQRAMIQVFYLDKGRLDSYRIGRYDKGSTAGFYHSSLSSRTERDWSSIADEAWNFNKFSLNTATDTAICPVTSSTIEGIWYEFDLILRAEDGVAELSGSITTNHTLFASWQAPVTNVLSGIIPVEDVTPVELMNALIEQESEGTHSYVRHDPLAVCSIGIGEAINNGHVYTDGGIGFCKVQPYNRGNRNLYQPSGNMIRSAQIIDANIEGVDTEEPNATTPERQLWYAVFKYNNGSYGGYRTPAVLRTLPYNNYDDSAAYADAIFTTIGLPRQ